MFFDLLLSVSSFCFRLADNWTDAISRNYLHLTQALANSKLRTTRHNTPVLIFDELKHDLLLRTAGGPAAI